MGSAKEKALLGARVAVGKKAVKVVILDMRELVGFTDYFMICSGETDIQVRAVAAAIVEELKKKKVKAWHIEGYEEARWVLLDYGDVVIHIFHPEMRQFYQLERLWADANVVDGGEELEEIEE